MAIRPTIVRDQDLGKPDEVDECIRIWRGHTFVITVCPPCASTKSRTLLAGALSSEFPPMEELISIDDTRGDASRNAPMKCWTLE